MKKIERKINNPGLGVCHIIKQNDDGYLIYSEDNIEHFIITSEIKDNRFYFTRYYKSLDRALEHFNKLNEEDIPSTDLYMKKIERQVILDNYIEDISNYCLDTLDYLKSKDKENYDVSEIIMYLSTVPETINEIKKIVAEIESKNS